MLRTPVVNRQTGRKGTSMRHLIDLCSTTLLHRLSLAPATSATLAADAAHLPPRHGAEAAAPRSGSPWTTLAAAANRWFRRRIESALAGRDTVPSAATATREERSTPSRYY
jgi:uncharacterized protein YbjT (DUF2867 family)